MSTNNKVPSDADAPPLVQWAEALRQHPDLTLDIQQAHAALRSDDAQDGTLRAQAVAAWQAIPPDVRAPFESAMLFVHMPADEALQALAVIMPAAPAEASRAFLQAALTWTQHGQRRHAAIREWLSRRYRNMWAAAPHLGLMAYSSLAIVRRRCTATTRASRPCRAWALWNDPRQLCLIHAGRAHRGPQRGRIWAALGLWQPRPHASYEPCRCEAYAWPHRPGGGRCRWPEEPDAMHPTPAGTHRAGRLRWRGHC